MFENDVFDVWLDKKAKEIVAKLDEERLSSEEMMILMLKAQTNHFAHLDQDLRQEMIALRTDMDKRFEHANAEMNKRFEQVDKRFEQVDKRFEQVDKRFEVMTARIDRFMIWSFATTVSVGATVIAAVKWLPHP